MTRPLPLAVDLLCVALLGGLALAQFFPPADASSALSPLATVSSSSSPHASGAMKAARWEYFFRLQRDPATNRIPANIRTRELNYARTLPRRGDLPRKSTDPSFTWSEVGPYDVGGRTRALAIDRRNPDVILAGGVSGGMWRSVDGGASWTLRNTPAQKLSVTSVAQDPTTPDVWYYASGEYRGNSASDRGYTAPYRGGGLYRSTDNGATWDRIAGAGDPTAFDSELDYVSRIRVSPENGWLFLASNAVGIVRSTDGGTSFETVLGGTNEHVWSDVAVASDGTLLAALSAGFDAPSTEPGVYLSTDDGATWIDLTPPSYPSGARTLDTDAALRPVVAFAPSDEQTAYVFVVDADDTPHFYRIDLSTAPVTISDRSDNMPDFGGFGSFSTQYAYDMMLRVKPDDEDFVLIGGTDLYRSADGFATEVTAPESWIGGYSTSSDAFTGPQHPDQHAAVFDPTNPDRMWSANDGGVYVTDDVTASTVRWIDLNNGYNVTQFYTVAMPDRPGDDRVAGGTQDNGTPFFRTEADAPSSYDISGGDGSHLHLGDEYAYTSVQQGRLFRLTYDGDGEVNSFDGEITPSSATAQLFINPFAVDPNDEQVIFYPAGHTLWRSTDAGDTWSALTTLNLPQGCLLSALTVSRHNPEHMLYFGASCTNASPRLYRLSEAPSATEAAVRDISIADAVVPDGGTLQGAYLHNIAVNPSDANEILVVHSNYNLYGLYHSEDGGRRYTSVEGNLTGNNATPGPSLRSAAMLPGEGSGTTYLLGTSTGLYTTTELDGTATTWRQEAASSLGNTVVEHITARIADLRVAAATHGRGIFVGQETDLPSAIFADFSARPGDNTVLLSWTTTLESDNEGFELQMADRNQPEEAPDWQTVDFIEGAGAGVTTAPQSYEYRIPYALPGTYRFRLKQVGLDGQTRFYPEGGHIEAAVTVDGTHQLTANHPNPFNDRTQFAISVSAPQPVQVHLYDVQGRRVRTLFDGELPADDARVIHVDARRLASGVYFYRAVGRDFADTGQLTVVR